MSKYYTNSMSFKRKSRDRSVKNTSGGDGRTPENEGEMSFKLLRKCFDKKIDEQNKRIESKLYSDARQTEKKLKSPTQSKKSTSDFKVKEYNISALLNWSKNWKTYVFLDSKTRSVV